MKTKRLLAFILTAILCVQTLPSQNTAKAEEGTEEEYTPIHTIEDLVGINSNPRGKYILMNDIDMTEETKPGGSWDTGHGWTPLDSFSGTFDGNGYRIIGINIYGDDFNSNIGLFRWNYGTIKRLGMVNINIDVNVSDSNRYDYSTGGIAGTNEGTIEECYVEGTINSNAGYVGGISGGYDFGEIINCYNAAKVSGSGISYNNYCARCYNVGEVTGEPIDGRQSSDDCYALQGKSLDSKRAKMCTEAQMRTQNIYTGFDFENVWEIDPNSSYPYPQLRSNRHQRVEGIEVATAPSKAEYSQNEELDLTGGTLRVIYEKNYETTIVMTEKMLGSYDMSAVGTQDIVVEYGGKKASFPITVKGVGVSSVSIRGSKKAISKGESIQLTAEVKPENATDTSVEWKSSDTSVATVENGKVTGINAGSVTITATASNGVSGSYLLEVKVPCVNLLLDKRDAVIYKGESATLSVTLSPTDSTDSVSWRSSNQRIASVQGGTVTGISAGEAIITANAESGVSASCFVTVKQKMEDFHITGVVDKEYTGKPIRQNIKVTDGTVTLAEGEDYSVSYSDNVEVGDATVSVTGMGFYEGSIKKGFSIKKASQNDKPGQDTPKPIGKVKISRVSNVKGRKLKVSFKAVSGADGYQIAYSTKSNMKGKKSVKTKKTAYTVSSLKKKKYYVQVRAYSYGSNGKTNYGKWSDKKSVSIKK